VQSPSRRGETTKGVVRPFNSARSSPHVGKKRARLRQGPAHAQGRWGPRQVGTAAGGDRGRRGGRAAGAGGGGGGGGRRGVCAGRVGTGWGGAGVRWGPGQVGTGSGGDRVRWGPRQVGTASSRTGRWRQGRSKAGLRHCTTSAGGTTNILTYVGKRP